MPIDGLMSASEVGALYHISRQRVSILAQHRKVGRHLGRMWVFTPEEVKAMQPGKGGRPKKAEEARVYHMNSESCGPGGSMLRIEYPVWDAAMRAFEEEDSGPLL